MKKEEDKMNISLSQANEAITRALSEIDVKVVLVFVK